MSDNDSIPLQKGESQQAFLRYLPKRIMAFEQRLQRYRREGWELAGMAVLKGDLLRLADASSHYQILETCRHLLVLARMVGEHVASQSSPDPQQARRMFAELAKVTESMPVPGAHQDSPAASETTHETDQHAPLEWQVDAAMTPADAKASGPATAAATEAIERVVPIRLPGGSIRWVLPSEHVEPITAAAPIEPVAPIEPADAIEWLLAEPTANVEPISAAAFIETSEPIVQQRDEPSADAAAVETSAPIETAAPTEPSVPIQLLEPETVEASIAHVDAVETTISPPPVEAAAAPIPAAPILEVPAPVALSGQAGIVEAVEPLEAVDTVDLYEDEPDSDGEAGVRRIFHLNDGNAFAIELGQRLEAAGYAVEPVESVDELSEMLMCLMPQMLLVDASHMSDLDAIDRVRRDTQQRSQTQRRIQMVALAAQDKLEARRIAHRAEVDVLLFPPFDIADVVGRLHDLDTAAEKQKVRVLIVDDERADAFFAQTVLARAGMEAHVETDPMHVLESVRALHPDLVLMDLHMPFANGVEVTMLIREDPVFARLPIVFLSGESDPDSRLEAINAGGDDFLFKPIRPRHLIAAVRERMRRLHPISKQGPAAGASDDPTGMQRRA